MGFDSNVTFALQRNMPLMNSANAIKENLQLKRGVWLYFFLLMFEGALRKWFLPGLSTPLLLVRDPIAIWLVLKGWEKNFFSSNIFAPSMVLIGIVGIYTAVFWGHGNLWVAVYGARIMFFHFPLIFVIGKVFGPDDVKKLGKILLWISIPMTLLIGLQFYSPQSAWVNRGVGGEINGAGFAGALGYMRPPGTFSFTNGTSLFYGLISCFVFYFWMNSKNVNRLLLICSTACLLAAIPLSISRGLFFQVVISLAFAMMAISRKPQFMGRMILTIIVGIVALIALSKTHFFSTATEAFSARFESASEVEGGMKGVLGDRYLGGMIRAIKESGRQSFFGAGLGMGTNVGSMLLTHETRYLIAEDEWARIIGELGPLMGLAVIFLRLGLSAKIALAAYRKLAFGDLLPWMLLSFGILTVPQAQWAQPTSLGFSILIGGLILASLRSSDNG